MLRNVNWRERSPTSAFALRKMAPLSGRSRKTRSSRARDLLFNLSGRSKSWTQMNADFADDTQILQDRNALVQKSLTALSISVHLRKLRNLRSAFEFS